MTSDPHVKSFGKKITNLGNNARNIPSKIDDRETTRNGDPEPSRDVDNNVENSGVLSIYPIKLIVVAIVLVITPIFLLIVFAFDHTEANVFDKIIIPYDGTAETIITLVIVGGIYLAARKFGFGRFTRDSFDNHHEDNDLFSASEINSPEADNSD